LGKKISCAMYTERNIIMSPPEPICQKYLTYFSAGIIHYIGVKEQCN